MQLCLVPGGRDCKERYGTASGFGSRNTVPVISVLLPVPAKTVRISSSGTVPGPSYSGKMTESTSSVAMVEMVLLVSSSICMSTAGVNGARLSIRRLSSFLALWMVVVVDASHFLVPAPEVSRIHVDAFSSGSPII